MSIPSRRATCAALSALAVSGVAPGLAHAANPKPCNGAPLIEDATDDSLVKPLGGMPLSPATGKHAGAPNEELENVWMSWEKGADGKKALTANIQLAKVDQTVPPPQDSQGGLAYYVFWQDGDTVRFLRAQNQLGQGFTYNAGHVGEVATPSAPQVGSVGLFTGYTTDAAVPGKLFEGDHGVVQMTIPDAKPGQHFGGVEAFVDGFNAGPDDVTGFNNHFDAAPDEGDTSAPNGVDYDVADCVPISKKARHARARR